MAKCYNCGNCFPDDYQVYRSTECISCGRDVKVCRNCVFYSPGSHWDCRETIPERVADKEKANFCGYFTLKNDGEDQGGSQGNDSVDEFNKLFS